VSPPHGDGPASCNRPDGQCLVPSGRVRNGRASTEGGSRNGRRGVGATTSSHCPAPVEHRASLCEKFHLAVPHSGSRVTTIPSAPASASSTTRFATDDRVGGVVEHGDRVVNGASGPRRVREHAHGESVDVGAHGRLPSSCIRRCSRSMAPAVRRGCCGVVLRVEVSRLLRLAYVAVVAVCDDRRSIRPV
jgi:hypothetical protein